MPKFQNRGQVAQNCVDRWIALELEASPMFGDDVPRLSQRQLRTLKSQIRQAIVRWEASVARE
jgi:hypothetical protein